MTKPTKYSFIRYKIKDTGAWKEAKLISMQLKQTVKYKNLVNVQLMKTSYIPTITSVNSHMARKNDKLTTEEKAEWKQMMYVTSFIVSNL